MRWLLFLVVAGVFANAGGVLEAFQNATPTVETELKGYPFSEIENIYETVLDAMLPNYFSRRPELAEEHLSKLEEFVRTTLPPEKFVAQMVEASQKRDLFLKARDDQDFQKTDEFQQEFDILVRVSVQMAMIHIASRFDVYNAKFLEPTEHQTWLFSIAEGDDHDDLISWTSSEVSSEVARKELPRVKDIRDGDRFFYFNSPSWYWEKLAGRSGYLQVRDGKIIEAHVTLLN